MAHLSRALPLLGLFCATLFIGTEAARRGTSLRSLNAKRLEASKRWEVSARGRTGVGDARRAPDTSPPSREKNITSTNPKASGAHTRVHTLPHLLVSCAPRLLPECTDHPQDQL